MSIVVKLVGFGGMKQQKAGKIILQRWATMEKSIVGLSRFNVAATKC